VEANELAVCGDGGVTAGKLAAELLEGVVLAAVPGGDVAEIDLPLHRAVPEMARIIT
jgi:hypothetical protein